MRKKKKKVRGKTSVGTSNKGNNTHSWHPYWLWQLLRRNPAYINAVTEIAQLTDNSKQTLLDPFSRLNELILDVSDQQMAPEKNFGTLDAYLDYVATGILKNRYQYWYDFEKSITIRDQMLLNNFKKIWGGLIAFPLLPSCINPLPGILEAIIIGQPVRIVADGTQAYPINLHKNCLAIELNLNHSMDQIERKLKSLLDQIKKDPADAEFLLSGRIKPRWQDMERTLKAYDLDLIGLSPADITRELQRPSGDGSNIKTWVASARKYISSMTPRGLA